MGKKKPRIEPQTAAAAAGSGEAKAPGRRTPWEFLAPVALIVPGSILLLLCSRGDLWFDEILSFQWANNATQPWDILHLFRHDNNHPLNTAWLHLLGENHPPILYRLPSVLAGIVGLWLLHLTAREICPGASIFPLLLAAFSFPLLLYGSEARGLSMAVMASAASLWLLMAPSRPAIGWRAPVFWLVAILGMLAHGSYLMVLFGVFLWRAATLFQAGAPRLPACLSFAAWFAVPSLAALAYYVFFLRPMLVAGGPQHGPAEIAAHLFGYLLGLPVDGPLATLSIVLGGIILLAGFSLVAKPSPMPRVFFIAVLLVAPAVSLLAGRGEYVYFRYFLVLFPFLYLLAGVSLAWLWEKKTTGFRVAALAFITVFFAGQAPRIAALLQDGRGGYLRALTHIAESAAGEIIVVSDQDLRNGLVVEFHRRRCENIRRVIYLPEWEYAAMGAVVPGWIITHQTEFSPPVPPPVMEFRGAEFSLDSEYPAGPVSGFHWFLYKQQPPPTNTHE